MPRWASRILLLAGLVAFAAAPVALAQQPASADKVTFRDRAQDGKISTETYEIKESAKGVEVIVGGKTKTVLSPADIVKIDYGTLPNVAKADHLKAMAIEDTKDAAKSQAEYADLLKKAGPGAPEKTRRYLQFREAQWATKVADAKTGDDFKAEATKAADKLNAVVKMSKKSWEVWPAARTAARLQMELGDFAKAAAILAELSGVAEMPKELIFEARLAEAAATLRADRGQALTVEGLLDQIEKDKDFPTGPLKERLTVLKAVTKVPVPKGDAAPDAKAGEALAKLRETVEAAKDPVAKAVGYNFLGDTHAALKQTRDAQWSYLWVDTVFNQDVDERVIACRKLMDLFEAGSDEVSKDRAIQFRDKLPRVR